MCLVLVVNHCLSNYLKSSERIRMKLSPDVCFGPRHNWLHFRDDPTSAPDTGSTLRSRSHGLVGKYI